MAQLPDGRKVFVPGAFVGDRVRLGALVDKKSFALAPEFELLEESPQRVAPVCPVAQSCGGCDWMNLNYEAQLRHKGSLIEQALVRTGGFAAQDWHGRVEVVRSPEVLGYRSRVRLQVSGGRVGFYRKGSHELVEVPDCSVSSPALLHAVRLVREAVLARPEAFEGVNHVEVRALSSFESNTGDDPASCSAHFVSERQRSRAQAQRAIGALRKATRCLTPHLSVRLGAEPIEPQAYEPVSGVRLRAAPGGFVQVNAAVNRLLIERVVEVVQARGAKSFVDLYCGSGNFALPLVARGLRGVGVELSPEAIAAARRAAREHGWGPEQVRFHAESAAAYAKRAADLGESYDCALVDPPRTGAKEVLGDLVRVSPPLLVMISCDPVTLARDLRFLCDQGYELRQVEGFDMFPQTHHVETLALLELSE